MRKKEKGLEELMAGFRSDPEIVHLAQQSLRKPKLDRRKRYLQIAFNGTISTAYRIISQLPLSDRIIIEAGTPLIKSYGMSAVSEIYSFVLQKQLHLMTQRQEIPSSNFPYVVADIKTADMAEREVTLAVEAGASGITCLGVAPIETIDAFIATCEKYNVDSMIDMMNVENPILILKQLKEPPAAVIVHRGVDETEASKEKVIPYYQINQIKGNCDSLVAIAGGDTIQEIRSAVFNGANIVVLWKAFYRPGETITSLVNEFLKEIR